MTIIDNRTASNKAQVEGGWNNTHEFIAIHYLGVSNADNPNLYGGGYGGHYYVSIDGKVYQSADNNAVIWHCGTGGVYSKRYPNGWDVTNYNCIGIECGTIMDADGVWRFTEATQQACVELVKYLMKTLNIPVSHVLMHGEITTKNCPACYLQFGGMRTNWTWEQFKSKLTGSSTIINSSTSNQISGGSVYMFNVRQIAAGATGNDVLLLQEILRSRGYKAAKKYGGDDKEVTLDKSFGKNTKAALMACQADNKLTVDGICGPATWKCLIAL